MIGVWDVICWFLFNWFCLFSLNCHCHRFCISTIIFSSSCFCCSAAFVVSFVFQSFPLLRLKWIICRQIPKYKTRYVSALYINSGRKLRTTCYILLINKERILSKSLSKYSIQFVFYSFRDKTWMEFVDFQRFYRFLNHIIY